MVLQLFCHGSRQIHHQTQFALTLPLIFFSREQFAISHNCRQLIDEVVRKIATRIIDRISAPYRGTNKRRSRSASGGIVDSVSVRLAQR